MSRADDLELDDTLRGAWQASTPASRHLDEDAWTQFFEGRLDDEARGAALDHVSACVRCAGVFKAARAAALAEVPPVAPTRTRAPRFMPQLALAATAALAVTIVVLRQDDPAPVPAASAARPEPIVATVPVDPPAPPRIEKPAIVIGSEQLLVTRSNRNNTAYLEALAGALEPYRRDEFGEAARRLAVVAEGRPDIFEPTFYLGASLLLDGKPFEAVPVLERAQKLASAGRREEVTRLLTLARDAAKQP